MSRESEGATAQRVFVRAAQDPQATCSKRRPRFAKDQFTTPSPIQLSSEREVSSIPVAHDATLPPHQREPGANWVYPSENQFFQAMQRKGWQPDAQDMSNVVKIHNAVNERAWREISHWEASLHPDCACPKLKAFRGRPREFSPKARLLNFLGYKLPFDRHDWIVDRCGRDVRYVIDFYNAAPQPSMPVAMHLDVRPALDSPTALWDRYSQLCRYTSQSRYRLRMQCTWIGSGRWRYET